MSLLETYWTGVLQRLQSEVDVFNRLIEHEGEKGQQNELSLARIIENFIPTRFGVGAGLVIDSSGRYSKQTDIIVYNRADEPALMAQAGQVLFPIENVRACIEVKTSASSDEITDAGEKFLSLRRLKSIRPDGGRPVFGFLGYGAKNSAQALSKNFHDLSDEQRPDVACVLKPALIAGRSRFISISSDSDTFHAGVAQLHRTEGSLRSSGAYEPAPADWGDDLRTMINGTTYPIVPIPKGPVLVGEPSRALLLFCDALVRGLLRSEGSPDSTFSHYIPAVAREFTEV